MTTKDDEDKQLRSVALQTANSILLARQRAEQRSEFYLAEGQRLAHTGSWSFNPSGFFDYWSPELFQIYGLDPVKGAPRLTSISRASTRKTASTRPELWKKCCGKVQVVMSSNASCDPTASFAMRGGLVFQLSPRESSRASLAPQWMSPSKSI